MVGRYEILIPVFSNDGKRFDSTVVDVFRDTCLDLFDGYTQNPTTFRGVWRDTDTGIVYDEDMNMYYVYSDAEHKALDAAKYAAVIFDQVAISVTKPGGIAVLVYHPNRS
jgi:hypothetical protein